MNNQVLADYFPFPVGQKSAVAAPLTGDPARTVSAAELSTLELEERHCDSCGRVTPHLDINMYLQRCVECGVDVPVNLPEDRI